MSRYDDCYKDELIYYIEEFLKKYAIFKLLELVCDAVENKEEGYLD